MNVKKLFLENIACFNYREFNFNGLTVVHGANRAGKSTCVYAIYYALFGEHLSNGLRASDLARKGEKMGKVTLIVEQQGSLYQLERTTTGVYRFEIISAQPNSEEHRDEESFINLHPEIASLTSFFREGELIYFLQDIPKYDRTLLQNLVGIDNLKISQSKFKQAFSFIKENKREMENELKQLNPDIKVYELSKERLDNLKKKAGKIEEEYVKVLEYKHGDIDPNLFKLLKKNLNLYKEEYSRLMKERSKISDIEKLKTEKAELEKIPKLDEELPKQKETLHAELIKLKQKGEEIQKRIKTFMRLERRVSCPVCTQTIPQTKLSSLIEELEKQAVATLKEEQNVQKEWKNINTLELEHDKTQKRLKDIDKYLEEAKRLDEDIEKYSGLMKSVSEELNQLKKIHGNLEDAEKRNSLKTELQKERTQLTNQINQLEVSIKFQEKEIENFKKLEKELKTTEKAMVLSDITHQAIKNTVHTLSKRLLIRVKESIPAWVPHFSFLEKFDIDLSQDKLMPIIQAKGYQYKLQQMSKSERIFLYLLMKLALGDSLKHLGIFILDDPADGLDRTQKQTLAYLLTELAQTRQIIVTTNNDFFANLFPEATHIDL